MTHKNSFISIEAKLFFAGEITLCGGSFFLMAWSILHMLPGICHPVYAICPDSPWDLVTPLVSLGFWILGLIALTNRLSFLTVAFFSLGSSVLSTGMLSGLGDDLAGRAFYVLLAWLSPVILHFHLVWSLHKSSRLTRVTLRLFYCLAGLWSIPFFMWTASHLTLTGWLSVLRIGIRSTLVLSVIAAVWLLIDQWNLPLNRIGRQRIRLVFSSFILAFFPLVMLSLLPELLGLAYIPYEVNFSWLMIIPIGYGYAVLSQKYILVNRPLIRLTRYYLIGVFFACVFYVTFQVTVRLIPSWSNSWAWLSTGLGILFLFILTRANQVIRRVIDWLIVGSDRKHLELLSQMTHSLGTVLSREELRNLLVDQSALFISNCRESALFLKTGGGDFTLEGQSGFDLQVTESVGFKRDGPIALFLSCSGPLIENKSTGKGLITRAFSSKPMLPDETNLLNLPGISLWIPLLSGSGLHGLWLVGLDPEEEFLGDNDRQVWSILAVQAGMAAHNVLMAETIQSSRDELARAHQELLRARDEERREIARELHDNPLQELLGMSFQIAALAKKARQSGEKDALKQNGMADELDRFRLDVLSVGDKLRGLIGELRPDGLEELGLRAALEGFIRQTRQKMGPDGPAIEIQIDRAYEALPIHVKICLFRVAQEAIRNAIKYAKAQHISLIMSSEADTLDMKLLDDGSGFVPPRRLSELARSNHFGLLGVSERIKSLNGELTIHSQPGTGTELSIQIPIKETLSDIKDIVL